MTKKTTPSSGDRFEMVLMVLLAVVAVIALFKLPLVAFIIWALYQFAFLLNVYGDKKDDSMKEILLLWGICMVAVFVINLVWMPLGVILAIMIMAYTLSKIGSSS